MKRAKSNCPYTFPHKSRKARVGYICGIGGYSSRDGRWPIEFNVAAYRTNFDFDHIWKEYAAEHIPAECRGAEGIRMLVSYYNLAKRLHKDNEQYMWGWGQEDAARDLDEREGDTYFQLWDGTPVKVKLELHGRGGKHLVIAEWDGRDLSHISNDELQSEMLAQTRSNGNGDVIDTEGCLRSRYEWMNWTNEEVELFYRYVRQCERDFTPEKASKQVEEQGAWRFFANIVNNEWETTKREIADHEAVVEAAQAVYSALAGEDAQEAVFASLYTLCAAAGVSEEEAQCPS